MQSVVKELFPTINEVRNIELTSYIEKLEDKFINQRDLLLSRATMDDDWNRLDDFRELSRAMVILKHLGIPISPDASRPLHLRKNE